MGELQEMTAAMERGKIRVTPGTRVETPRSGTGKFVPRGTTRNPTHPAVLGSRPARQRTTIDGIHHRLGDGHREGNHPTADNREEEHRIENTVNSLTAANNHRLEGHPAAQIDPDSQNNRTIPVEEFSAAGSSCWVARRRPHWPVVAGGFFSGGTADQRGLSSSFILRSTTRTGRASRKRYIRTLRLDSTTARISSRICPKRSDCDWNSPG